MKEPSTSETAFTCPHCDAFAHQFWHEAYLVLIKRNNNLPFVPGPNYVADLVAKGGVSSTVINEWADKVALLRTKALFAPSSPSHFLGTELSNLFLSQCFNCKKWAIWVNEDLVYPPARAGEPPNQDLPQDIVAVIDEARSILCLSPKGAAALLRLAVQKLCVHLGEPGKDLNRDIGNLVANHGLSPTIQKSLDVVRVVGNESVHPGTIDLNDDKDTATRLFELVNLIADQLITQPKRVNELYERLPEAKRDAIAVRDTKNA